MSPSSQVRQVLSANAIGFEVPRPEQAIQEAEALDRELVARGWQFYAAGSGREYVAWTAAGSGGARVTVAYLSEPRSNGSFVDTVTVQVPVSTNGSNSIRGYLLSLDLLRSNLAIFESHEPARPIDIPGAHTFTLSADQPVRF
ncbi:hypothetical protein [Mycobacteroides abscessus]|uniref:hypothetical protein n=1 Tax=Mycobacteroides abscessus TaxID=36809 RepID=UPI001041D0FB|nr:hypothetical protein [Mycobacteroides abscessus]